MKALAAGPYLEVPGCRPSGVWGPTSVKLSFVVASYVETMANQMRPMIEAGIWDVIAIHVGHGYLVDHFLWEESNLRTDYWAAINVGAAISQCK